MNATLSTYYVQNSEILTEFLTLKKNKKFLNESLIKCILDKENS